MKYAVVTFGCRVNQADSLAFEEQFRARGAMSADADEADIVVVNTCSVTASADQAARQTIRRIARINPGAKIVVTGCYATRRPDEIGELAHVTRVIPNADKSQLIPLAIRDFTTADRFGDGDGACGAVLEPGIAGRTAFTLRVQTGCAEECSYCIIPATRGRPASVPIRDLLIETDRIISAGFKEIALTGVHLGSYGRDLSPASSLIDLLAALCRGQCVDNREWTLERAGVQFRISSLEPMDCTKDIVDLVATSSWFAPHFHLPLQHASDRMLAAMRRPYTIDYYRELVETIRARIPHASIGSDVIVGFPGESEEDFSRLTSYLESSPLTHIHVFPYSDRPGTCASKMGGHVPGVVVRRRAQVVRDIGRRLAATFRESQVGDRKSVV